MLCGEAGKVALHERYYFVFVGELAGEAAQYPIGVQNAQRKMRAVAVLDAVPAIFEQGLVEEGDGTEGVHYGWEQDIVAAVCPRLCFSSLSVVVALANQFPWISGPFEH